MIFEWFMSPIGPWWALLAVRLFSFAMLGIALERAAGAVWKALRPALPVWRFLWATTREGKRVSVTLSLLRVQAEVTPVDIGLSVGRSAWLIAGFSGLMFALFVLAGLSSQQHSPPLTPVYLLLNASLSVIGLALGWVSPTARAREQAELRARGLRPLEAS